MKNEYFTKRKPYNQLIQMRLPTNPYIGGRGHQISPRLDEGDPDAERLIHSESWTLFDEIKLATSGGRRRDRRHGFRPEIRRCARRLRYGQHCPRRLVRPSPRLRGSD